MSGRTNEETLRSALLGKPCAGNRVLTDGMECPLGERGVNRWSDRAVDAIVPSDAAIECAFLSDRDTLLIPFWEGSILSSFG